MSTAVLTKVVPNRWDLGSVGDTALKASVRFWFAVAVIGPVSLRVGGSVLLWSLGAARGFLRME